MERVLRLQENPDGIEQEASLLKLLETVPGGYADVHNKLGLINHEKGDLNQAADFFKKAIEINPRYTEASLNLAITLNDLGRYEESSMVLSSAAMVVWSEHDSVDPYVRKKLANEHAQLGDQYTALGLLDDGIEQYRKALQICPDLVDIVLKLGIALREKGKYDEAIETLNRAKKIHPLYVPAMIQLGLTYYIKGFLSLAFSQWEAASKILPEGRAARIYLTLCKREEIDE